MATLAIFIALGGTGYAAATIRSGNVVDDSLLSQDLKDGGAVRSADVVNDSVTGGGLAGVDVRRDTLGGVDIDESKLGRVPNAESLGGKSESHFLGNGSAAGGGLAGTFPSPQIAPNAVDSSKVADGSLTAEDIDEGSLGGAAPKHMMLSAGGNDLANPETRTAFDNGTFKLDVNCRNVGTGIIMGNAWLYTTEPSATYSKTYFAAGNVSTQTGTFGSTQGLNLFEIHSGEPRMTFHAFAPNGASIQADVFSDEVGDKCHYSVSALG